LFLKKMNSYSYSTKRCTELVEVLHRGGSKYTKFWVFLWRGRFQVWGIGYYGIWIGLLAYLRRGRVFIGIEMVLWKMLLSLVVEGHYDLYGWLLYLLVEATAFTGGGYCIYWWRLLHLLVEATGGGYCIYWWRLLHLLVETTAFTGGGYCIYWWRLLYLLVEATAFS
jgi:hypothetical protein